MVPHVIKLMLHDGRLALDAHVLVLPLRLQLARLPHTCLQALLHQNQGPGALAYLQACLS